SGAWSIPVGIQWIPWQAAHSPQPAKPFVAVGIGPVIGASSGSFVGGGSVFAGQRTEATVGGHVGGGVDVLVAHSFSIGLNGGYNWMLNFAKPVGSHSNYRGPEFGVSVGWLFGRGRQP